MQHYTISIFLGILMMMGNLMHLFCFLSHNYVHRFFFLSAFFLLLSELDSFYFAFVVIGSNCLVKNTFVI